MIMHPISTNLNNQDLSNIKDADNKYIFVEMNDKLKNNSFSKTEYKWNKPNETEPKLKFSYVQLFNDWGNQQ